MPDYTPNETTATFKTATGQPARPTTAVTLDLPTELVQWFRSGNQPDNWQSHMADVLRFYVDSAEIAEADAELMAQSGMDVHSDRLSRSEQPPHTPAGQIAEALQNAANYRQASQIGTEGGKPDQGDKNQARAAIDRARSIRLDHA